jgi:hypothetical protein
MIAKLEDAIQVALGWTPSPAPRPEIALQTIYFAVAKSPVVTENDKGEWGGQSNLHHRVRSVLARMVRAGTVERTRSATYRSLL